MVRKMSLISVRLMIRCRHIYSFRHLSLIHAKLTHIGPIANVRHAGGDALSHEKYGVRPVLEHFAQCSNAQGSGLNGRRSIPSKVRVRKEWTWAEELKHV